MWLHNSFTIYYLNVKIDVMNTFKDYNNNEKNRESIRDATAELQVKII
jgi:hypothetical protein